MSSSNESAPESRATLAARWNAVGTDPDLVVDLGYECVELEFIRSTGERNDFVVVVPVDPTPFDDDVYIVAHDSASCDLERMV